jgi:hypothetical protein
MGPDGVSVAVKGAALTVTDMNTTLIAAPNSGAYNRYVLQHVWGLLCWVQTVVGNMMLKVDTASMIRCGTLHCRILAPGTYSVVATAPGCKPASRQVTIPPDGRGVLMNFLLSPLKPWPPKAGSTTADQPGENYWKIHAADLSQHPAQATPSQHVS